MKAGSKNIGIRNILHYRLPLAGIVSILHRMSGVLTFLIIPFLLWLLKLSLNSEWSFIEVKVFFGSFFIAALVWLGISALVFHLMAGLRHIMMDLGYFESLKGGKVSSMVVMLLGALFAIVFAFYIFA